MEVVGGELDCAGFSGVNYVTKMVSHELLHRLVSAIFYQTGILLSACSTLKSRSLSLSFHTVEVRCFQHTVSYYVPLDTATFGAGLSEDTDNVVAPTILFTCDILWSRLRGCSCPNLDVLRLPYNTQLQSQPTVVQHHGCQCGRPRKGATLPRFGLSYTSPLPSTSKNCISISTFQIQALRSANRCFS